MATNNKNTGREAIYACSPFYHMAKVLKRMLNSPVKWRDNGVSGKAPFHFSHPETYIWCWIVEGGGSDETG